MRAATHFNPPPWLYDDERQETLRQKEKLYIPSDRPRNNADRDALKYAKTPSMYGYIKLPVGWPTKTIDSQMIGPSPSTADTALAPATTAAASRASSVKVKMSKGLAHCLSLNLDPMKEILKHVFNITESIMRKPRAIELLMQALILNPSN